MYLSKSDARLLLGLRLVAVIATSIVILILAFLCYEAWPTLSLQFLWQFAGDDTWHPTEDSFYLVPFITGTLFTTLGAVILASPLAIGSAIFCRFYAPRYFSVAYLAVIEVLAGIPSVVYGFWGLVVLVPIIASWQGPGTSLLAGILVLTMMILPTAALLAYAALQKVPKEWIQGAYALGMTRWAMIWHIAIPTARPGLGNAILLQSCRALGETMAVLMVCGNTVLFSGGLFEPVRTLSANIALEMSYAMDDHRAALYFTALVLMLLVCLLLLGTRQKVRGSLHV